MKTKRPIIKFVDPQEFLIRQFLVMRHDGAICPNCGEFSVIEPPVESALTSREELIQYFRKEQFQLFLGLCSDNCSKEFLKGDYDVLK